MAMYYLGCPIWGNRDWVGDFFTSDAKPKDFLRQYAQVFNTVEGNTTFYGLPTPETVAKWGDATPESFRFAFKFPKTISHEKQLDDCQAEVDTFLHLMRPLGPRVGPLFLQLPPRFADLAALDRFLAMLPKEHDYAVEARHQALYGELERDFVAILEHHGADRVTFDTTRLMALRSDDSDLKDAQRRKPKNPPRPVAVGARPFLRYVGHPDPDQDAEGIATWAKQVAAWLDEGRTPYAFMHLAPEDDRAPYLAKLFHEQVRTHRNDIRPLAPFPSEGEPKQLSLF